MKNLKFLIPLSLTLASQMSFANLTCEEVTIGEYKNSLWNNSLSEGLTGKIVNQINERDDLFESLTPEVEVGLNEVIDLKIDFSRKIRAHLPKPSQNEISLEDIFKYKINNEFRFEVEGRASSGILFSEGLAGVHLTLSTERVSRSEQTSCELYQMLVDKDTKKGSTLTEAVCEKRDKNILVRYYENLVNTLSQGVGSVMRRFSDSEKNLLYSEDPLSPFKLHSTLGIPLDHTIFFENNTDIAIGDIIELTTFFGIKPLGVELDILNPIQPSYAKYRRFFRTINFKKIYGNKVLVDIRDTTLSGGSSEVFKINPSLLKIIKLNFGRWGIESFHERSLTQSFEIDLNKNEGLEFFKDILFSAYKSSLSLNKNSILIDASGLESSVKAFEPIFSSGFGRENMFFLQVPGLLKYDRRSYESIRQFEQAEESYLEGSKLYRRRLKNKIAFDFKLFEIKKADKNYECQMQVDSKIESENSDEDASLNINCQYNDKYLSNKKLRKAKESLLMTLNGDMHAEDIASLDSLDFSEAKRFAYSTSLSFSAKDLKTISAKNSDEIRHEVAKAIFGEEAENVFSERYRQIWRRVRSDRNSSSLSQQSRFYRNCSKVLAHYGIIPAENPLYSEYNGIVGRDKGLNSIRGSRCDSLNRVAGKIEDAIGSLDNMLHDLESVEEFLDIFRGLPYAGIMQNVLYRLAGGIADGDIRYNYLVTTPDLEEDILRTNGAPYTANIQKFDKTLAELMQSEFHARVADISFSYKVCDDRKLKINFEFNYPVKELEGAALAIRLEKFNITSDSDVQLVYIKLDELNSLGENKFSAEFDLVEHYDWKDSHNAYVQLLNLDGVPLSEEAKVYIQRKESLFEQL